MTPDGILETVLYAEDIAAAERFYSSVVGLRLVAKQPNHHLFYRCGQGMLMLFNPALSSRRPVIGSRQPVPPHGARGPGHVCFRVFSHDMAGWLDKLRLAHVKIEADFTWPQGGRSIYFRDPAGNSLELAEPRIWSVAVD